MMRLTGQEMIVTEKIVGNISLCLVAQGHKGHTRTNQEAEGARGKCGLEIVL